MKAEQFLRQGADVLAERGKEYDKPEGERSMQRCVSAFEIITGKRITEAEGWLFMQILKDVRQWQNPGRYHEDSAVDCVNYSALKAEALSSAGECEADFTGLANFGGYPHPCKYGGFVHQSKPSWDDAPEWANALIASPGLNGVIDYGWASGFFHKAKVISCEGGDYWGFDEIDLRRGHCWYLVEPRPSKEA